MERPVGTPRFPRWSLEALLTARLLRGRKGAYVTLISLISILGLALGVASLIIILSVTSGFELAFRDKLLGIYPHLVVIGKGGEVREWRTLLARLDNTPGLVEAAPATYDEMMASYRSNRSGAIVKGLHVDYDGNQAMLKTFLSQGDLQPLDHPLRAKLQEGPHPTVTLDPLPGGMVSLFLIQQQPEATGIPLFLEDPHTFVVVNTTDESLTGTLPGLLQDMPLNLPPSAVSAPVTVTPAGITFTLGSEVFSLEETSPRQAFIIYRNQQRLSSATCPIPAPGSAADPAFVCLLNTTELPLQVDLGEGAQLLKAGELLANSSTRTQLPGVLLGDELARRIEATVGDEIRLISPLSTLSGLSSEAKKGRTIADTFRVVGLLHLGFYEYDSKLAVIGFDAARRFLHQGDAARWIEVRLHDLFGSADSRIEVGRRLRDFSLLDLQEHLPGIQRKFQRASGLRPQTTSELTLLENLRQVLNEVRFSDIDGSFALGIKDEQRIITWEEMNEPLFTSMKRQKIVLALFFLIVIMVAAFNVVSSQVMVVREKTPEISMLKAMGARRSQIHRAFLWQGLLVGGAGVGLGAALAAVAGLLLHYVGFPLDPQVYFVSSLPVSLQWSDFVWASGLAMLLVYVSVSVAARRASALTPVEGLRNLE